MEHVELLTSLPVFAGIARDDLAALAQSMVDRRVRAGQMVFHQGDQSNSMYIVAEGYVNIHLPGDASRRISLKDAGQGECFGEMALFDEQPRSASVVATTDVRLYELSREAFAATLERRPRAAMDFLKMMAGRLRETNAMLSERAAKNAVEEIEKHLSWKDRLADRVATLNGSWAFILLLVAVILGWTLFNALLERPFDPYPYVFFNLVLAIVVVLQGPLIVMSQNRQNRKDRASAETDFKVNLKNEVHIETILRELGEFRGEVNSRLQTLERSETQTHTAAS